MTEYSLELSKAIERKLGKLAKRDRKRLEIIDKKAKEIVANPERFKPLRGDLKGRRRVHIDSSFVPIYETDEILKIVRLLDFGNHDKIYKA